jgi:hypothetical protein
MDIRVLQIQKRSSYEFKYIQDKFSISPNKRTFAIADGTTQSFNSEIWAEIITSNFVSKPTFNGKELIGLFTKHVDDYKGAKFEYSINPAKASLEKAKQAKGGTATFLGLQLKESNKIDIVSCGDTNLFLLNTNGMVTSFPFSDVDSLDSSNNFINTEYLIQGKIDETYFKRKTIDYYKDDVLILATDALSRLILRKPSVINELINVNRFDDLLEFSEKYWNRNELEEDDITAVIIPINSMSEVDLINPPKGFSFPKEKEGDFEPTPPQSENKFTNMQFNEIIKRFNRVDEDFHQVKKKLNLHDLLLMILISLLLIIILLMYFRKNTEHNEPEISITERYENTIEDLKSEIKTLKDKVNCAPQTQEDEKNTGTISKDEASNRQNELLKAGYKLTPDGIWGDQSEKMWDDYQKSKKGNKDK